eukprot:TRINITY_DN1432_c0_g1_i2.p4 TRINITY_DN1432_c0_g1~~TRINITY_DN1432_c0_g1_i2.p4  ORF type:complete len:104 (+),score=8.68 TRINITY_DN1432_c0_g1_i2:192-503(+)
MAAPQGAGNGKGRTAARLARAFFRPGVVLGGERWRGAAVAVTWTFGVRRAWAWRDRAVRHGRMVGAARPCERPCCFFFERRQWRRCVTAVETGVGCRSAAERL